jgi:hypothetical protein
MADVWTLRRAEQSLGTISITDTNFPWLNGTWTPDIAFAQHADLFATELKLLEKEDWDAWEIAYEAILSNGIRLHYPDGRAVPEFLLHIDSSKQTAWFRWSDEPFK